MKLATLDNGTRDGQLLVVRNDGQRWTDASDIAATMQAALDDWEACSSALRQRAAKLDGGDIEGEPVDTTKLRSPLPRAYEWVDGSAFLNHVILVRRARNAEPPPTLETDPLVYQGGSGIFLSPREDIVLHDPAWGLDFEAEVCVVLGDTPLGVSADEALEHVRLVMLCNDITLRSLIPTELAKSFGFFNSKPASAFSPFAVTPDELGEAWKEGRLHRHMRTTYNGELVGNVFAGPEMHFSFAQLIAHIAKTRAFTPGTILGSGTISNEDETAGISCLAERRMREIIKDGEPSTPFMKVGDTVHIEVLDDNGNSIFGAIEQQVVAP